MRYLVGLPSHSNLVEYLDRLVTRQWKGIYRTLVPPAAIEVGEAHASYAPARAERRRANAQAGEAKYQQALALREKGLVNKELGKLLGVGARTIGRWLSQ